MLITNYLLTLVQILVFKTCHSIIQILKNTYQSIRYLY